MQSLGTKHEDRVPAVIRTVATTGEGLDKLASAIEEMKEWLQAEGRLEARRRRYWRERLVQMVLDSLMRQLREHGLTDAELDEHAGRIARGEEDPYLLVPRLVAYDKD